MIWFRIQIILICCCLLGCQQQYTSFQGYVDADYTYLSSSFSGKLIKLNVARGQEIKKDELLFVLEAQPEQYQLQSAEARATQAADQLVQQRADLNYQSILYTRYKNLIKHGGISREEFNNIENKFAVAQAVLKANEANLKAYQADLEKAKWNKSNKTINAPFSGYIFDTYYTENELVPAERPVLSLVTAENLKIVFYIPEPFLSKIRLNEKVNITCDGCNESFPATISYISSQTEYTPPYIYSDNIRTKFIYRIEAKPTKAAFLKLHPGQPVSVSFL